jgi:acyl-CoA hydrolase
MTIDERIEQSETRIFKAVFPNTTNHYDTLFGGTAMALMDEVAFITATRFSRKRMVTVSSDRIDFQQPIPAGTIIELIGRVIHVGNTSVKVLVDLCGRNVFIEKREGSSRQLHYGGCRRSQEAHRRCQCVARTI